MAKQYVFEVTDEQLASIQQYVAKHVDWIRDEFREINVPVPKWANDDAWAQYVFAEALKGPLDMFKPAAVQALDDQIAALQAQKEEAIRPKRVEVEARP